MAEPKQITFTFQEVVEALLKKQGIHEGVWAIYIRFGISGANITDMATQSKESLRPAAVVPLLEIGLQRFEEVTGISVDAAVVNPSPKAESPKRPKK